MFPFSKKLKKATREDEEAFRENLQNEKVSFKDGLAMVIAAFITIVLPCLLVLLLISGVAYFLFT